MGDHQPADSRGGEVGRGGSTDATLDILSGTGDPVLWRSESDSGQSDAINKAFVASSGEIIGWLNSDDAYYDSKVVEDVVAFFRAHPAVDVVYGHSLQITAEGNAIQVLWAPPFDADLQRAVNLQVQPSTFVRRRALRDPMLDTSLHFAMDYELWLRLAAEGREFGRVDRILSVDRHQLDRKSATIKDVLFGDLERLAPKYDLHLGPEYNRQRTAFYRRQRLMGAMLIPGIHPDRVAFTPGPHMKAGLWRRQIGSRRTAWPK
ncbi:MAG: glycosyltransferase, partial [Planctomycetota bacterium]